MKRDNNLFLQSHETSSKSLNHIKYYQQWNMKMDKLRHELLRDKSGEVVEIEQN